MLEDVTVDALQIRDYDWDTVFIAYNTFQILQKFAATPITNQCGMIRELMSELLKTVISNYYKFASKKYDENRQ